MAPLESTSSKLSLHSPFSTSFCSFAPWFVRISPSAISFLTTMTFLAFFLAFFPFFFPSLPFHFSIFSPNTPPAPALPPTPPKRYEQDLNPAPPQKSHPSASLKVEFRSNRLC